MHSRFLIFLLVAALCTCCVTSPHAATAVPRYIAKPRPTAGIGILTIQIPGTDQPEQMYLYEEPGLIRIAGINPEKFPTFDHIFGTCSSSAQLIVTARKQQWLKVIYDEAGREGWLHQKNGGEFKLYSEWLRQTVTRLLPGLQKKYYQLYRSEGVTPLATVTAAQNFKILRVHNSWAYILTEQNQLGWLRWKDEDGRLLIGLAPLTKE